MINRSIIYFVSVFLLVLALAWFFSSIFIYFIISMVFATILRPLTSYLSQISFYGFSVPRFMAVIFSFFTLIATMAFFILLFIPLVNEQIQILIHIDYEELLTRISAPLARFEEFLIRNELAREEPGALVNNMQEYIASLIQPFNLTTIINHVISLAGSFFIGLLAVVFITFFLLYEKGLLRKMIIGLIPNKYFEVSIVAIYKIEKLLSNYLLGLMLQMFSIFSIVYLGLLIIGVNYALAIAVFAAFANLIPYLGPILGASFGIFVALSTGENLFTVNDYIFVTLQILLVFAFVQITDNLLLQPLIFSKSIKAHPLEIFIIIFVGATLAGILGMIAAIPTYTVVRVTFLELFKGYKQYSVFKS
jgi:predicted PurR-regulated permease PerM